MWKIEEIESLSLFRTNPYKKALFFEYLRISSSSGRRNRTAGEQVRQRSSLWGGFWAPTRNDRNVEGLQGKICGDAECGAEKPKVLFVSRESSKKSSRENSGVFWMHHAFYAHQTRGTFVTKNNKWQGFMKGFKWHSAWKNLISLASSSF